MSENALNDLSIEELKKLKNTIEKFSNIEELSSQITTEIKEKEENQKKTYNARLKLSTLTTFGLEETKDFYNMDKQDPRMKNDSSKSGKTR